MTMKYPAVVINIHCSSREGGGKQLPLKKKASHWFVVIIVFVIIINFTFYFRSSSFLRSYMNKQQTHHLQQQQQQQHAISCPYPTNSTWIIYNRLPKCGSSSTKDMLPKLAEANDFQFEISRKRGEKILSERMDDPALVRALDATKHGKKTLYVNHVFYWGDTYDIAPYSPRPAYIQIVREPIERSISEFYYFTQGKHLSQEIRRLKTYAQWANPVADLNKCVQNALYPQSCTRSNHMTRYFCGYARECAFPSSSPQALEMAIANLHKYVFVGLLGEFTTTFKMLERLLPQFFNGSSTNSNRGRVSNPTASNETITLLRKWNANDLILYELIVEKFHKEVQACGLQ